MSSSWSKYLTAQTSPPDPAAQALCPDFSPKNLAARQLQTARLTLRLPQASDLPAYTAYCASDRTQYVGGPFTAPQAFDKLAAITGHWTLRGYGRYVLELNGQPIGHAGPLAMDDSHAPEMTWSLWEPQAEGHGYATEAVRAVQAHLATIGLSDFIIRIMADNAPSRRVAERLGATLSDDPAPDWLPGAVTYWLRGAP